MRKIALIAPEADKLAEIKKMLADYEQEIIFKAASIHDGLKIIGPLIEQGVEIIIARGEAAAVLQLNHPIYVVHVLGQQVIPFNPDAKGTFQTLNLGG